MATMQALLEKDKEVSAKCIQRLVACQLTGYCFLHSSLRLHHSLIFYIFALQIVVRVLFLIPANVSTF